MRLSTQIQFVAVLAVGAALGFVTASGDWFDTSAAAAIDSETIAESPKALVSTDACTDHTACCSEVGRTELLLAQADIGPQSDLPPVQFVAQAKAKSSTAAQKSTKAAGGSGKKPNILIIWGDDIGWFNISANNNGMMGYKTPNIDRLAKEGANFTDWYGQNSCTAGRACFITGQVGFRTGLLTVGMPGAPEGIQARDVTLAQLLKAQGYATAQFGKNHLGDRDEHLPTMHGFDEFMGSLYHLNAEEEPENADYFKDPAMVKKYVTRGVLHTWANPDGTQKIESTGPLSVKRMETIDEEVTKLSLDYLQKRKDDGKPFFLWWNSTRTHVWTHLKKESEGKTGFGVYADGLVEHDAMVGQLLDKLKELGLDENTIVMYSTDNGAEKFSWPDGGNSPFRNEKNSNWEGAYRVPCFIRWPGVIKPGSVFNDIFAHEDMVPTLMAAAGVPDVKEQLLKGMKVGDKTFKVHLDGYNITDALAGNAPSPRKEFFYFADSGSLVGLRFNQWKVVFQEQRHEGAAVWREPFVTLRRPKVFNLRTDPFETADREAIGYERWWFDHGFVFVPAFEYVGSFLSTFKEFPPSQKVGGLSLDAAMESLSAGAGGK
jgi:arylsulfatase